MVYKYGVACFNFNMRVLHLPIVICNQPWEKSRALRRIGVECDYMIYDDNDAGWLMPGPADVNLNIYHHGPNYSQKRIKWDTYLYFIKALLKYDVFHYHSNVSLLENFQDLKILKFFGKKILVSHWGCDIRLKSINSKKPYNVCQNCKIGCDDVKKKEKMIAFAKYADAIVIESPEMFTYNPNGKYVPILIDTNYWKPSKQEIKNTALRVFHPVGNLKVRGDAKGTFEIGKAVKRLNKEGYKIELFSCDKVSNRDLKPYYEQSDLVIEGLRDGTYGITTMEGMAMARPVMCYIWPEMVKYYPGSPVINTNPDNIYEKLKWAVTHRAALGKIGQESRKYILKVHDSKVVARQLYKLYKSLYK